MLVQSRQVKSAPEYKKESHLKEAPPSGADLKDYTTVIPDLSSVQWLSRVQLFATPWRAAGQAYLSNTSSWSLLKAISIESVMPSNHFILCHPLLLLPSIFPGIRVFSNESALRIRGPKYWSFNFSISPSSEYSEDLLGLSGLISLQSNGLSRAKGLSFEHHNSKASILQRSAFFLVQVSHPYMTTGKTIGLTI